ncbi:hypothetical protein ACUOCP_20810, partial [Escherichia sp. R-CC3]
MAFTPFPPRQPTASARLPLTLMTLDDWALATITGADSEKYMQGQVTADVSCGSRTLRRSIHAKPSPSRNRRKLL